MNSPLRGAITGAKSENPVANFSRLLDTMTTQIQMGLPAHMNADRVKRIMLTQFSSNKDLQDCDVKSILGSMMTASQMGLEIGINGAGFLVAYGGTCTFVPGWKGLVDLVNRAGRSSVWTGAVYDGDFFDYALGDTPFVKHKPGDGIESPEKLLYVYAIGRVNGSQWPVIEVWSAGKVRRHRDKFNKVGKRHYSYNNWEMYARKIPLLQVLKYMPSSVELANAIAVSEAADNGQYAVIQPGQDFVSITDINNTFDAADGRPTVDTTSGQRSYDDPMKANVERVDERGDGFEEPGQRPAAKKATGSGAATAKQAQPDLVVKPKTYAQYVDLLQTAKNADDAALVMDEANHTLPRAQAEELSAVYKAVEAKLNGEG